MRDMVTAKVRNGRVIGVQAHGVCRFSAIPYALAPTGALRWRPPVPADWSGEHDGTQPGPVAPQLPSRLREAMGDFDARQSEDCLHLTVWTPAPDHRRRPVVVWLHGGAWQSGGGALDWYDAAALAALGDVVVVSPNYRLAALGWLHVPGHTANVGLLDQEAALEWVCANIESLGGDPSRVTVMGQSAGATNIVCMLARKPVFARAILQSAVFASSVRSIEQARRIAEVFVQAAGADDLDAAHKLPVQALLHAQNAPAVLQALQAEGGRRGLFGPVADGEVLPLDMASAFSDAAGRADLLVGYTAHEMRAFPGTPPGEAGDQWGDKVFGAPARAFAAEAARRGRQAWLYRFDHAPTARWGACHCIELPFLFGTLPAFAMAPMLQDLQPADGARLTQAVQRAWIAFIRGEALDWQTSPGLQVLA